MTKIPHASKVFLKIAIIQIATTSSPLQKEAGLTQPLPILMLYFKDILDQAIHIGFGIELLQVSRLLTETNVFNWNI